MSRSHQTPILQLLIQIDGLSRPSLEDAMASGATPAIERFAHAHGMRTRSVFSGLPSTTPAVQAEFFYGARHAVPAFAFLDRDRSVMRHMLDPAAANAVQRELDGQSDELLSGGAAYCDIYTGGAVAARFCPAGLARPREALTRSARFQIRSAAAYAGVLTRALGMLIGEIARGATRAQRNDASRLSQRIGDAWNRIIATIALRDQARISAIDDIAQGLPVIHINFVGYDKQAHKYGPESPAARRTLQGIDRAIETLLRAAENSDAARVTTVIHSDHGQETTTSFDSIYDDSIDALVRRLVHELPEKDSSNDATDAHRRRVTDAISEEFGERVLGIGARRDRDSHVTTVESGPIAHLYAETEGVRAQRHTLGQRIAASAPDIAVLWRADDGSPRAAIGSTMGDTLSALCDSHLCEHPFRDAIPNELDALLQQTHCGDIILLGTGFGERAVTFAPERGSHGGPGPRETHAFAIAPESLLEGFSDTLRFDDLRAALLRDRAAADGS